VRGAPYLNALEGRAAHECLSVGTVILKHKVPACENGSRNASEKRRRKMAGGLGCAEFELDKHMRAPKAEAPRC
jgi:hypothetical protein